MKKILTSAISLIISVSFLVGAPVTEKESDKYSLQKEKLARKDKDDSRVKSEDEIWVKIEAKILEVEEDAFLDASKNLDGSPGVIPGSQASILLNALTREEGSGLLSAPEVTVKNGEEAKIQVVQEFVFPTGKPSTQVTGEGDGGDEHPDLVQEVGIQLSVTPTVQKNNQIDLILDAKVTKLDGFVEQNKGIPMPIFSERKVTTQVTLSDGCLLYTSPSPRDRSLSRMPSSA